MRMILLIILILLLVGALPTWPYSTGWGYLSERWPRPRADHRSDSGADGSSLMSGLAPGLAFLVCSKQENAQRDARERVNA